MRVTTVQVKKNETYELIQDENDCGLIPDPAKNHLEDPSAIFADCGSVEEEKMMQVGVHSIGVVKLSKHSSSSASRGEPYCFSAKAIDGTRMSATGRISARESSRLGNLLISDRPMKYKDYG